MIGSAVLPFRLFMSRGCKVHAFALGPQFCSPPLGPYGPTRAFDAPLRRRAFSPRPEPATRRTGAYRGGTFTRKSDVAWTRFRAGSFRTHHSPHCSPARKPAGCDGRSGETLRRRPDRGPG